jgi:hypothetical protein
LLVAGFAVNGGAMAPGPLVCPPGASDSVDRGAEIGTVCGAVDAVDQLGPYQCGDRGT